MHQHQHPHSTATATPLLRHTVLAAALAAALVLLIGTSAAAQGRTLEISTFHSDIVVQPGGSLEVTEVIAVRFTGSWNGILRQIPVEYRTDRGANYTLQIRVLSVQDPGGNDLRYEAERTGRNRVFRIYVPGANNATRSVVFRYSVANGLRFFEEHDELYWNVTGDESEHPILAASARVELPAGISGLRTTAFAGPAGSVEGDVLILEAGNSVEFRANQSLRFREGLTIVVGWNPGIVSRPSLFDGIRGFFMSNFLFLIPVIAAGGMFVLWRRHGRDPDLRPLMPEYEPPEELTPAEAGTLFDTSPDLRDVTATIVDLAVRGFLVIEESAGKGLLGIVSRGTFTFRLVGSKERWDELKGHERELLHALFSDSSEVRTSELENSFYKHLPRIKAKLDRALVRDGHYLYHPRHVRVGFLVGGIVTGALVAIPGALFLEEVLGQQPSVALTAGILTALIVAAFGMLMPARTKRGTRVFERLRGFEEFLRRVESDRFEKVIKTPEMFEQYLPYAMAFGVESNWATAFDDIYQSPPDWYHGGDVGGPNLHVFRAHAFTGGLSRMSSVTGTTMTSAPRSTSGSSGFGGGGFGGGGFSGGGFGGGGVGGF